jgi:hypothetical protein
MKCELCGGEKMPGVSDCPGCGDAPQLAQVCRRWWMKKRWRVVALAILAYPFTLWLAVYLAGFGVIATPSRFIAVAYTPVCPVIYSNQGVRPGFEWFADGIVHFYALGRDHAGLD